MKYDFCKKCYRRLSKVKFKKGTKNICCGGQKDMKNPVNEITLRKLAMGQPPVDVKLMNILPVKEIPSWCPYSVEKTLL